MNTKNLTHIHIYGIPQNINLKLNVEQSLLNQLTT